jgi:hypothetical protein
LLGDITLQSDPDLTQSAVNPSTLPRSTMRFKSSTKPSAPSFAHLSNRPPRVSGLVII